MINLQILRKWLHENNEYLTDEVKRDCENLIRALEDGDFATQEKLADKLITLFHRDGAESDMTENELVLQSPSEVVEEYEGDTIAPPSEVEQLGRAYNKIKVFVCNRRREYQPAIPVVAGGRQNELRERNPSDDQPRNHIKGRLNQLLEETYRRMGEGKIDREDEHIRKNKDQLNQMLNALVLKEEEAEKDLTENELVVRNPAEVVEESEGDTVASPSEVEQVRRGPKVFICNRRREYQPAVSVVAEGSRNELRETTPSNETDDQPRNHIKGRLDKLLEETYRRMNEEKRDQRDEHYWKNEQRSRGYRQSSNSTQFSRSSDENSRRIDEKRDPRDEHNWRRSRDCEQSTSPNRNENYFKKLMERAKKVSFGITSLESHEAYELMKVVSLNKKKTQMWHKDLDDLVRYNFIERLARAADPGLRRNHYDQVAMLDAQNLELEQYSYTKSKEEYFARLMTVIKALKNANRTAVDEQENEEMLQMVTKSKERYPK